MDDVLTSAGDTRGFQVVLTATVHRGTPAHWLVLTRPNGTAPRLSTRILLSGTVGTPEEELRKVVSQLGDTLRGEDTRSATYTAARRQHRRLMEVMGPDRYASLPGAYVVKLHPPGA